MFTGIVEKNILFSIESKTKFDLTISADLIALGNPKYGDSIAINGVCLTVSKIKNQRAYFDLMNETLVRTTFSDFSKNELLNIEHSLTLNTKIDGHLVYGEIDCVGKIVNIKKVGNSKIYTFTYPPKYAMFLINKGRITVDGASLSVINADKNGMFDIGFIPHTLNTIAIKEKKIGDNVNLEFDIYVKIVYKQRNFYEPKK